jgi:hypothetical protein
MSCEIFLKSSSEISRNFLENKNKNELHLPFHLKCLVYWVCLANACTDHSSVLILKLVKSNDVI